MADIARKVGLGRSTVSMALRNHPEIPLATRERVHRAAQELGYRPDPLLSLLMSNLHDENARPRDTVLAVLSEPEENWNWRDRPLFQTMWAGMEAQALRRGYRIEEFRIGRHGLPPARVIQVLLSRSIVGAVIAPKLHCGPSAFTGWDSLPCVTLNWSVVSPHLPRACTAAFRNFNSAWDALEERGYRRISFLTNPGIAPRTEHQYVAAHLMKLHLQPPERRIPAFYLSPEKPDLALLRAWLEQARPDAVIVDDAHAMLPILRRVTDVPAALGVAALELGNSPAGMAGIDEHSAEIGAAAVDMLIGRLQRNERGLPAIPRLLHVPGSWREGATARPLPPPPPPAGLRVASGS